MSHVEHRRRVLNTYWRLHAGHNTVVKRLVKRHRMLTAYCIH